MVIKNNDFTIDDIETLKELYDKDPDILLEYIKQNKANPKVSTASFISSETPKKDSGKVKEKNQDLCFYLKFSQSNRSNDLMPNCEFNSKNKLKLSWEQFTSFQNEIAEFCNLYEEPLKTWWYRGHSNTNWRLIPSLYRASQGIKYEQQLFNDFQRESSCMFPDPNRNYYENNDWTILCEMQHYGIPTRLLDWTESLGHAIAFAILDLEKDVDTAIYVLDPIELNKRYFNKNSIIEIPNDDFTYKSYFDPNLLSLKHPIAINPKFQNTRMRAQRGTFIVYGLDQNPLEEQCPDVFKKFILPASACDGARKYLRDHKCDELSIYPDIDGIAKYLRKKYQLNKLDKF